MSYQVLARKWRPQTFADVVGQQHVLTALANGLRENRLHHAYLFSGTRGVGKTSIARLFAKGLNCVQGVTAEPCGECENCRAIEQGNFIDLIEIDAASRTKVEDTRELLDNVQYKPVQGRYKVYLIDEVHMLSRHSFNALLKTLEEPPEYVKFLLATTEPHKLPITILSRCMQFHLKALEPEQIAEHLEFILKQEKIPFEPFALEKLAKAAQGSVRDSLSLTDQAIAMGNGEVNSDLVSQMLGLIDESQPIEILYALQQGDGEKLMLAIEAVAQKAGDWDELLKDVAENLHQIAMQQLLPRTSIDDSTHIGFLAKHIAPQDVQFFYQVIVMGRKELAIAPSRRIGAEMTLLRALAFHPKFVDNTVSFSPSNQVAREVVEMPVLSQAIKSHYQPQKAMSKTQQAFQQEPSIPAEPTKVSLSSSTASALNALDQLNQIQPDEKKNTNSDIDEKIFLQNATERFERHDVSGDPKGEKSLQGFRVKSTALSAVDRTPRSRRAQLSAQDASQLATEFSLKTAKTDLSSASYSEQELVQEAEDISDDENEEILCGETYRWEWSNPQLAEVENITRPSDIKAEILKDITDDLNSKIVKLASEQDSWNALIEQSGIEALPKNFALNCFVLKQDDNQLILGLRTKQAHLNIPKHCDALLQALKPLLGDKIALQVELNDDESYQTALEHRHRIYRELCEQAKMDLINDPKIQLLQREFSAQLDTQSIRPT